MKKAIASLAFAAVLSAGTAASAADLADRVQLVSGKNTVQAVLDDNLAAKAFLAQLPLRLTVKDYNSIEKIAELPQELPAGNEDGFSPKPGDIGYFKPWNNIVVFYGSFRPYPGLYRIGHLKGDVKAITQSGSDVIVFEKK